jgi:toxin YoeB
LDGPFEVGRVFVDGGLQDRVCGVEVAVGVVVAHAGDLPPRDRRLRGQQIIRQCFNSLADLKQADADGVEDQPVGQVATLQVGADRVDRGLDIGQPLTARAGSRRAGPRHCRGGPRRGPRCRTRAGCLPPAFWLSADRTVLKRISRLIDEAPRDPADGIGKPEPLRHMLAGTWSRRISEEHRLVYPVEGDDLVILSAWFWLPSVMGAAGG